MELNNRQICEDIFNMINSFKNEIKSFQQQRKPTILSDDYYINFITFLKNSFIYEHENNKDLNIVDYINDFKNLKLFYKIISNPNVFIVETPLFHLFYLADNNELTTISKHVSEKNIYGFVDDFNNDNSIFVLYMVRNNGSGMVRYITVDKDPRYLQLNVKDRLKRERRLKLDKINEI